MIESLIEKCDVILLGGGMIFTFFKAKGLGVGKSLVRVFSLLKVCRRVQIILFDEENSGDANLLYVLANVFKEKSERM